MRLERLRLQGPAAAAGLAARVRALAPSPADVSAGVAEILGRVRERGDEALLARTRAHDLAGGDPRQVTVEREALDSARAALAPDLAAALELAIANVGEVARAALREDRRVRLAAGQEVLLREVPVRRAGIYVPGGAAPYPSSVVMGVVSARVAGVDEVAVCSPPQPDGELHPLVLGACALTGADRVHRAGGAQAIAALAYGTASVDPVDVIAGPGSLWVSEAKRQVFGAVGIDGLAGPSDLVAVLSDGADPRLGALDLLAQAEHGPATVVVAISPDRVLLDAVLVALRELAAERPVIEPAAAVLIDCGDLEAALALAEALAPEHLELSGAAAEALAPRVRAAGCVLVGPGAATAFGDYVAGSNHVLPTGGVARFSSGLGPWAFRRRVSELRVPAGAAGELAAAGAALARAEGFDAHAESMEARIGNNGDP
ncbi:MAG: histidinol dehydrogenase [Solirubrobacteraceae bacterium]